jgi:hypothetical protein
MAGLCCVYNFGDPIMHRELQPIANSGAPETAWPSPWFDAGGNMRMLYVERHEVVSKYFVVTLWHSKCRLLLRAYYLVAASSSCSVCLRIMDFLAACETMESLSGRIFVEWALTLCQSSDC